MNLSQDEINALLSGKDPVSGSDEENGTADIDVKENGDIYSAAFETEKQEIQAEPDSTYTQPDDISPEYVLTDYEEDTIGEVGNMCMGAVATTMYTLLDRRVSITTPRVSIHTTRDVLSDYSIPFVIAEVQYTEGVEGKNLFLLKESDAALITDLLMGGDGVVETPIVLNELHMSAIAEVMNQMCGASATALSKLLHTPVNISPPKSGKVEIDANLSEIIEFPQVVVKISFDMVIEGLLESQLLQILPYDLARGMAKKLINVYASNEDVEEEQVNPVIESTDFIEPQSAPQQYTQTPSPQDFSSHPNYEQPVAAHMPYFNHPETVTPMQQGGLVNVRPMQFESFDKGGNVPEATVKEGLEMIYDIPLEVSVELGKTKKDISEILKFGTGTVVVLEKIAGDPVEILANGKIIARGEVVVIDENYGVRITELFNN